MPLADVTGTMQPQGAYVREDRLCGNVGGSYKGSDVKNIA